MFSCILRQFRRGHVIAHDRTRDAVLYTLTGYVILYKLSWYERHNMPFVYILQALDIYVIFRARHHLKMSLQGRTEFAFQIRRLYFNCSGVVGFWVSGRLYSLMMDGSSGSSRRMYPNTMSQYIIFPQLPWRSSAPKWSRRRTFFQNVWASAGKIRDITPGPRRGFRTLEVVGGL